VDVEIISTRSRYSASSGVSRPATSESEGLFDDRYYLEDKEGDEDEDEKYDDDEVPAQLSNKKVSASKKKRDDALKSEVRVLFRIFIILLTTCVCVKRPMTKAGSKPVMSKNSKSHSHPNRPIHPVQVDENANDEDIPEDQWPKVAHLTLGGLTHQGRVIREICRDAIRIVEATLVTKNAWPELHKGTLYKRQVLLEAVNALRVKNKDTNDRRQDMEYKAVRDRISKDEKFIRTIGKWVRNFKVSRIVNRTYIFCILGNRSAITSSWTDTTCCI
jgi:hypothetical protein